MWERRSRGREPTCSWQKTEPLPGTGVGELYLQRTTAAGYGSEAIGEGWALIVFMVVGFG